MKAKRSKLIEKHNQSREVQEVSDLFPKLPSDMLYNPIFFKIHIPLSLQRNRYIRTDSENSLSEDFDCVYAGGLLFISTICTFDKEPYGVFDVRDRVYAILEKMTKIKVIPPTLFGKPIVLALKTDISVTQSEGNERIFEFVENDDSKKLLRDLFEMVGFELEAFYEICVNSHEIFERVAKIEDKTLKLLDVMSGSYQQNWKNRLGADTAERRKDILEILSEVSKCQSQDSARKRAVMDFRMIWKESDISLIIKPEDVRFYGEPQVKLDTTSVLKSLEFARSELDSRSRNRFALLSAFTGAIVGSLVTLLVSYML